jgi:hypothetical protein
MNRTRAGWICALALALPAGIATGQEPEAAAPGADQAAMMAAWQKSMAPGEPHAALAKAAGTWKMTSRVWMDPNGEAMISDGTAERQMILGGRVLEERSNSLMMGMPFEGIGRTGYDNVTDRYWSSWIDNMSTGVYLAYGSPDAEGDSVTYHGEFDNPMTGGKTKVRSVVRWEDENTQHFEWFEDHGGGEARTMLITYERAAGSD